MPSDDSKVSLVIASHNRAYTLKRVISSFFEQDALAEIILVDDGGSDDTESVFRAAAAHYPDISAIYLRAPQRQGQPASRNQGVARATQDYVLFCDDDLFLEPGYAKACLALLLQTGAGAVGGRLIMLQPHETQQQARIRFGKGLSREPYFDETLFHIRHDAWFDAPISAPLISSIFVTPKALLLKYGFDPFYSRGSGYREESDYQANLFVNGYELLVTNDAAYMHLPWNETLIGGQRTSMFRAGFYAIRYTFYFYDKYYSRIARRLDLKRPKWRAKLAFARYAMTEYWWQPFYDRRIARRRRRRFGAKP